MDIRSLLGAWEQDALASAAISSEPRISSSAAVNALGQSAEAAKALTNSGAEDIYHGAQGPTPTRLLAQSGINAYTQLQNVLANSEAPENSAGSLTARLASTSAALQSAYEQAVSRLPARLQA